MNLNLEIAAGQFAAEALHGGVFTHTGGDSASSDGFVRWASQLEAQIEVTTTTDEEFAAAIAAVGRLKFNFDGPNSLGDWVIIVPTGVRIKGLASVLEAELGKLALRNRECAGEEMCFLDLSIGEYSVNAVRWRPLGTNSVSIYISNMSNYGGPISTSADSIESFCRQYIEEAEATAGTSSSKFAKLVERSLANGRSAQFVLVLTDCNDASVFYAMYGLFGNKGYQTPSNALRLPQGIERFWLVREDFEIGYSYSDSDGWSVHGPGTVAQT